MNSKLIKILLLSIPMYLGPLSLSSSFGEIEVIPVWTPVPIAEESKHLLIVFQEAEFIRAHRGEWLPNGLYDISGNDEIYYRVMELTRQEMTKMTIKLGLYNKTTNKKTWINWVWTLPKDIGAVEVVAQPGVIEVRYPKTGEIREIRMASVKDIPEAKKRFEITGFAERNWKWKTRTW